MFTVAGAVQPDRSSAFVGESSVIKPGSPPSLTDPAKTVITNPTFIQENIGEAASFGGNAEANGAARVFQAGRIIPTLGVAVAGFTAGWEVGAEICGLLGMSGCLHIFGEPGSSAPQKSGGGYPTAGEWRFETGAKAGTLGDYNWVWYNGANAFEATYQGHFDCNTWVPPTDFDVVVTGAATTCFKTNGKTEAANNVAFGRTGLKGLSVEHTASDSPSIPNLSYTPPSEWPQKTAEALGATVEGGRVGQEIASRIPGSGIESPYDLTVEVPDCDGLVYAACEELLEERGLKVTRVTKTWETADVDADPDEVLELDPKRATEVEKGSTVKVTTNPDEAGMPILIPTPEPGETYDHYAARLNPALDPERVDVSESYVDPHAGPNAVLTVSPKPGSRHPPGTTTDVTVRTNPPTAPPAGGGGGECNTTIGAVDLSPLEQDLGHQFPFGLFVFVGDLFGQWEVEAGPPKWDLPVVPEGFFGSDGVVLHIDFAVLEPYAEPLRVVMLVLTFFGMLWFLATAAMKMQGDNS